MQDEKPEIEEMETREQKMKLHVIYMLFTGYSTSVLVFSSK